MYSPRHARPSCLSARAGVGSGLAALLLPLTVASPALADGSTAGRAAAASSADQPAAQTVLRISATPADGDGRSSVGVRLLAGGRAVPATSVHVQARTAAGWQQVGSFVTDGQGLGTGVLTGAGTTAVRARFDGGPGLQPQVSAETVVHRVQQTTRRLSATPVGADGRSGIGVRLLGDGRGFRNGSVQLEAATGSGWRPVGRLLTGAGGLAVGRVPFSQTTRIRATYAGSTTRTAATSPELVVRVDSLGRRAVALAARQQGKPYRHAAAGPRSFDCSGLVTYVYQTRLGKSVPRTSAAQARATTRISKSAKQPGDLIFYSRNGRVGHVGIYAGNGRMWAAPLTGGHVRLQPIYSSSYLVGRV